MPSEPYPSTRTQYRTVASSHRPQVPYSTPLLDARRHPLGDLYAHGGEQLNVTYQQYLKDIIQEIKRTGILPTLPQNICRIWHPLG